MATYPGIAAHLRAWGLKVVEVGDWKNNIAGYSFAPRGVIVHHTAGSRTGDAPSLGIVRDGRPGIPGPLSQFVLGRSGTVYVVGAGRANHAGVGYWNGITDGNTNFWGIEAENTGLGEPWGAAQLAAYYRLCAALGAFSGFDHTRVIAHKEWAPSRKYDPAGINMAGFREQVRAARVAGPSATPVPTARTPEGDYILQKGSTGAAVVNVQNALKIAPTGTFDQATHDAVVRMQRNFALGLDDGIVNSLEWRCLRGMVHVTLLPSGDQLLKLGVQSQGVVNIQNALKIANHGFFNVPTEIAVNNFQHSQGLPATSQVDEATWAKIREVMPIENAPSTTDRWLGLMNPPMVGQDIINVQNALVKAGNHNLEVNGVYDAETAEVIRLFQANRGITERGVGPETWAALRVVAHS